MSVEHGDYTDVAATTPGRHPPISIEESRNLSREATLRSLERPDEPLFRGGGRTTRSVDPRRAFREAQGIVPGNW